MGRISVSSLLISALAVVLWSPATGQVQFKIPVTFTNGGSWTSTIEFGVSGDGTGGSIQDNTYAIDIGTGFGLYEEFELPPAPPTPLWETRFQAIPNRPSLGTGLAGNFYGLVSPTQVDSFLIELYGSDMALGSVTVSWPSDIGLYATSCILKGNLFDPGIGTVDMLTTFSITVPNGALLAAADLLIIKTGAMAPSSVCDDFTNFVSRCTNDGTVQARVVLSMNTSHVGEMVEFTIDENSFTAPIVTNGVSSRAQISVDGYSSGTFTISVVDPPGCFDPRPATCAGGVDTEWVEDEALWAAEIDRVIDGPLAPAVTTLMGNYPNPFNPSTTITYALSEDGFVSLRIYNMLGQQVATLVNEHQTAGIKSTVWDGRNDAGLFMASDMYLYRLTAGNIVLSEKILLVK